MRLQVIIFVFACTVMAKTPDYVPCVQLQADGINIDVGHYGAPCAGDLNNDGKIDLLVGCSTQGKIHYFENTGTNNSPVLSASIFLKADGKYITVPGGLSGAAHNPQLVDWNDDGLDDIIMGDALGNVHYFRRTGSGVFDFTVEGHLSAREAINVQMNSAPLIVDWNNDGMLDLVLGSKYKALRLYLSSETLTSPILIDWTEIESAGSSITRTSCNPNICDLNGDGKKDLLIAAMGGSQIFYYENRGTDAAPVFNGSVEIKDTQGHSVFPSGSSLEIIATDWNGDGVQDLIGSSYNGKVYISLATGTGVSENLSGSATPALKITPEVNPASNYFLLKRYQSDKPVAITVHNLSGRMVESITVSGNSDSVIIDARSFAIGLYLISASDGNNKSSCMILLAN